jgi:RNA polymerase sigma-70 factor (ECF subfamily)
MTDNGLSTLRRLFLDRYDDLKARLTQRLGSADLAGDAMQDTWLRLARTESVGVVQSPRSYLFRIALNVAEDRRRTEQRRPLSAVEIESLLELADDAPTPEQTVVARSDLEAFKAIVDELPRRRRAIFRQCFPSGNRGSDGYFPPPRCERASVGHRTLCRALQGIEGLSVRLRLSRIVLEVRTPAIASVCSRMLRRKAQS